MYIMRPFDIQYINTLGVYRYTEVLVQHVPQF